MCWKAACARRGTALRITAQLIEAETGRASLGRQIRRRAGGRFRPAGSDHRKRGRRRRAEPAAVGDRTLQAKASRKPRRLRPLSARFAPHDVRDARGRQDRRGVSGGRAQAGPRTTPPPMRLLAWCHEICFMRGGFDEADKTPGSGTRAPRSRAEPTTRRRSRSPRL